MQPSLHCSGKTAHQTYKTDQTQASAHHGSVRTSHSNWHHAQWKGFAHSAQLAWFNVAQVQQKWHHTCWIDLHRMYKWMVNISSILPGVSDIRSSATQTIDPCRACTIVPGDRLRHKHKLLSDDVSIHFMIVSSSLGNCTAVIQVSIIKTYDIWLQNGMIFCNLRHMFQASHHLTSLTESVDGDTSFHIQQSMRFSFKSGPAMSWIAGKVVQLIISWIEDYSVRCQSRKSIKLLKKKCWLQPPRPFMPCSCNLHRSLQHPGLRKRLKKAINPDWCIPLCIEMQQNPKQANHICIWGCNKTY